MTREVTLSNRAIGAIMLVCVSVVVVLHRSSNSSHLTRKPLFFSDENNSNNNNNLIPVHVSTDHNDVIRRWYNAINDGKVARRDVLIVHIDTHSDLHLPSDGVQKHLNKRRFKYTPESLAAVSSSSSPWDNMLMSRKEARLRRLLNPYYWPTDDRATHELSSFLEIQNFLVDPLYRNVSSALVWIRPNFGDDTQFMQPSEGVKNVTLAFDHHGIQCAVSSEWEHQNSETCDDDGGGEKELQLPRRIWMNVARLKDIHAVMASLNDWSTDVIIDIDLDFFSAVDPAFKKQADRGFVHAHMQQYDQVNRECYKDRICCRPRHKTEYRAMWRYVEQLFHPKTIPSVVHAYHVARFNSTKQQDRRPSHCTGVIKRTWFDGLLAMRMNMNREETKRMYKYLRKEYDKSDVNKGGGMVAVEDGLFSENPSYVANTSEILSSVRQIGRLLAQLAPYTRLVSVVRSVEYCPHHYLPVGEHAVLDMLSAVYTQAHRTIVVHHDDKEMVYPPDCTQSPPHCYHSSLFL